MKMANLKDLKRADDAARVAISLTKLIIGDELSQKVAEVHLLIFVWVGNPFGLLKWMIMNEMNVYLKQEWLKKRRSERES